MLDVSPGNLLSEIRAAERARDAFLKALPERKRRYHGPYYSSEAGGDADPENHVFEYVALSVPRKVWGTPRVKASTRRSGPQGEVAKALELGLNRWIEDSKFTKLADKLAYDDEFGHAVAITSLAPRPGLHEPEDPVLWPQANRVSPDRFGWDPCAQSFEEARFLFHKYVRDKDSVLKEAKDDPDSGWDVEVIEAMAADAGIDELRGTKKDVPRRNELVFREVWVPEHQIDGEPGPEEGYHGTIFTIAETSETAKGGYPRKPRGFYGPRWGPYTLIGTYIVPDEVAPLSNVVACEQQAINLNDHVRAADAGARAYKRIVVVNSTDPKLPAAIKNLGHDVVLPAQNFKAEHVMGVEVGGVTAEQVAVIQMLKERLDRNSGIDEVQRGNSSSGTTATAVAVANEASTLRSGYSVMKFRQGIERVLVSIAWLLYHTDEIEFPLGQEARGELGMEEPWFHGGTQGEGSGATFDDLEIELEIGSMEKTAEGVHARRAAFLIEFATNVAPLIPMTPFLDWKYVLDTVGSGMGVPELSRILNAQLAAKMGAEQLAMQKAESQPRTGRDKGAAGGAAPKVQQPAPQGPRSINPSPSFGGKTPKPTGTPKPNTAKAGAA